jgi:predicted metalloprotease
MQWSGRRESGNVEDRRGFSAGRLVAGGGIGSVVVLLIALLFGMDPSAILNQGQPDTDTGTTARRETNPTEDSQKKFVAVVLADTEDVWNDLFRKQFRKEYPEPKLVLFSGGSQSGCGFASSATGPFYCPQDQKVYLDLQFFQELQNRFKAAGDFAQAYVVAHEVGHHVQKQIGILDQVNSKRGRMSETEYNKLSVRLELQADFLAGVWANHAQRMKNILDPGDLEEALGAANAIGDDRLQKQGRGHVVPDSFTHGTSAQRVRWFRLGFETGDISRAMELFNLEYSQL